MIEMKKRNVRLLGKLLKEFSVKTDTEKANRRILQNKKDCRGTLCSPKQHCMIVCHKTFGNMVVNSI